MNDERKRNPRPGGSGRPSSGGRPGGGGGRPSSGGRPSGGGRGRPDARAGAPRRGPARRPEPEVRTEDQQVYDGPPIPDDISAKDLDRQVRDQLRSLPEKLAERIAKHLIMAGLLIEQDPERAYKHALAARARSQRTAVIREAVGETAYAAGMYAEALAELRTARRLSGRQDYAPMMADCERALGRPEKALSYDTPAIRESLDQATGVELSIVVAGARRDLGQVSAALNLLESEPLHSPSREEWLPRLRYAYADTLLAADRREEAVEWFHRAVAVDGNSVTDAEDRLNELG
ncbi:MAG: tetratricopeptide repeat protein [Aeromicrobium sp.]